jgi:hypothetical protein
VLRHPSWDVSAALTARLKESATRLSPHVDAVLTWIWLSVVIVLLGAELNAEMEHQTARDSTEGMPKPLGTRGANMADHVGASHA